MNLWRRLVSGRAVMAPLISSSPTTVPPTAMSRLRSWHRPEDPVVESAPVGAECGVENHGVEDLTLRVGDAMPRATVPAQTHLPSDAVRSRGTRKVVLFDQKSGSLKLPGNGSAATQLFVHVARAGKHRAVLTSRPGVACGTPGRADRRAGRGDHTMSARSPATN